MTRQESYELATLNQIAKNPQGARMDIIFEAMEHYSLLKQIELLEGMRKELNGWGEYQAAAYMEEKITSLTHQLNQLK